MSVTVTYGSNLTVAEVLATNVGAMSDKTVTHSLYNTAATVTSASTPPATLVATFEKAMSGGAATIDLTALVGTNGATVDGSGLRVQFAKFRNKSTNANNITLSIGASNGYDGFGAAFSIVLVPGAEVLIRTLDAGSDIAAGKKTLDLAGTLAQVLECEIVLG